MDWPILLLRFPRIIYIITVLVPKDDLMNAKKIVVEIDKEIERLTQVRVLLTGANSNHLERKPRSLSPEARQRIAHAQKRRWAKAKKQNNS